MKRGAAIIILMVLLSGFFISKLNVDDSTKGIHISGRVIEEVSKQNNTRVIIKLKESNERGIASENVKKEIKSVLKDKVKHEFNDKISAVISEEELKALEENPNIKSIEVVGTRKVVLQDSVPLINASITHNLKINGINLTGEGQTICIIDTGIDYNHSSFGNCYGNNNPDSECKILGGIDFCADDSTCTTTDDYPDDQHGHGTHVAGIAAGNSSLKGVAPGAKLIVIKASNSSGTFWDDDLEKAINWCVDNASLFNISVISMSLGGGLYSSYCDSDPLADEINNAFAHNISVVVASGNDGSTTQIEGPACVQNATPVGGTDKNDLVYSNGNRNSLVMLLAPGVSINSSIPGNSYTALSGTSMSTPHVSGAIAIINEFLKSKNETYTPFQIEALLNSTGKRINDSSGNGLNYSRIDVYGAIYSLDDIAPSIALLSPLDNSYNESENVTFECSASDTLGLNNITFYLWNSSSDLVNESSYNLTGNYSGAIQVNISGLINGSYEWNCMAEDIKGNSGFNSENFTRIIGQMMLKLISPEDNTYTKNSSINFSCSANNSASNLSNISFYLWNSTDLIYNETKNISGTSNTTEFNYTFSKDSRYNWTCKFIDREGNEFYSLENYTIVYDATSPVINLESPDDNYETTSTSIDFEYNATDSNEIDNCSLIIDNEINETDTSISNGSTNRFSNVDLTEGNYEWKISCSDILGNTATTAKRDLSITSSSSSSEDSSSSDSSTSEGGTTTGGETGAKIYVLADADAKKGVSKVLSKNDQLRFKVKEVFHSLKVLSFSSNEVKVTISSNPINLTLKINETKKVDIDSDKVYDLEVRFNSLTSEGVNITLKTISEAVGTREISEETNKTSDAGSGTKVSGKKPMSAKTITIIAISIISGLALIGIAVFGYKKRKIILSKLFKSKK